MSQTLFIFLSFFCMFGWASAGQCAFNDDFSLIQEHSRALPKQEKWPNISKIVDKVKEAADAVSDTAKNVNDTVHDQLDQAATLTSNAIQTVVRTLQEGLVVILHKAETFEREVKKLSDDFLQKVKSNPKLQTFELAANQTLDAFGTLLEPIASALNVSIGTARDVLRGSGYYDLSEDVGTALTTAMDAINEANSTRVQLKQKMGEFDAKVSRSAGNLSREIDEDLKLISEKLHDVVEVVNKTFVENTLDGYTMLVTRLRESVEGILPEKHFKQVTVSLDTIQPFVGNITEDVARPIKSMATGFDNAINQIRENVPGSARFAASFSLLALVLSLFTSMITL